MSGQTIRDVVIRVSIENSGMKLGPIDTSGLESQLAGITGTIRNTVSSAGVGGRYPGGWQGRGAIDAPSILRQHGLQNELSDYLASMGATKPTKDERKLRQTVSDNDIDNIFKAKKKDADAAQEAVKRQEESIRAAQQANESYVQSLRSGASAAMEMAKGLAFLTTTGRESDAELAKSIVTIQGYYNVVRGGMNAVNALGDMRRASASSGGDDATGLASNAAASGVGSIAPRLMNPYAALAAAALGVGLFQRSNNQYAVQNSLRQNEMNIDYASRASEFSDAATGRHVGQDIRMSSALPNFGEMRQGYINQARRRQTEIDIRAEQDSSTRDYGARMEMRERGERRQSILERTDSARNNVRHIDEQIGALSGTRDQFEKDKARSEQDYRAKIANINRGFRKPTGVSRAFGIISGQESDYDVKMHNLNQTQELREAEAARQQELNHQKEVEVQLDEKLLQLGQQKSKSAEDVLNSLKAQADASRQNYERDKQTVDSAKERLGAMNEGEIHKIKGVQAKMQAGVELQQWEIQTGLSAGQGTKVYDYALAQARRRAESKGIEYSPDVQGSKTKMEADEANLNSQRPQLLQEMENLSKSNEDLGKQLVSAIRQSFDIKEVVEAVNRSVGDLKTWTKEQLRLMKPWLK